MLPKRHHFVMTDTHTSEQTCHLDTESYGQRTTSHICEHHMVFLSTIKISTWQLTLEAVVGSNSPSVLQILAVL